MSAFCLAAQDNQSNDAGIEIIAADSPGAFVEDTPTATLVRQVLGAVAQFDKEMTAAKLRLARDRVRKRDGKCEGRKSHAEERPEAVALARQLHKQGMTYRAIGAAQAKAGHVNERGRTFHHKSIRAMLE
jgi:DNA invertase Pin-like site-specific DNA recombinase